MTTVFEGLREAQGVLSRSEARILLAAALKKPKEFLISHPETLLSDEEKSRYDAFLERAFQGEPIPYILGMQEFWGRNFLVTPATLIPRPDTETLVEEALRFLKNKASPRVLDLGTGSGCIAVSLALDSPNAEVWACDKSAAALRVAEQNARVLQAKVHFVESDWFDAFAGETFDLIVSNPPYVEENDEHLQALSFEPVSALTSGPDGLDDIRILAKQAVRHLRPQGCMLVEHGYNQGDSAAEVFRAAGFADVSTLVDLADNPRVCRVRV